MPSWSIWLIAGLSTILILCLSRWQAHTQTLPSGLIFESARATDYPSLDQFAVSQGTQTLLKLGFEVIDDTLLTAEQGSLQQQFSRLLWHPTHHCYAQLCTSFERAPQTLSLVSLFTDGWSLTTTTQPATALSSLSLLEKSAWYSDSRATASELLNSHLRQRELIAEIAQLSSLGSAEAFYIKAKEQTFRQRQVIKRQLLLLSWIKGAIATLRPTRAWSGIIKTRRASSKVSPALDSPKNTPTNLAEPDSNPSSDSSRRKSN